MTVRPVDPPPPPPPDPDRSERDERIIKILVGGYYAFDGQARRDAIAEALVLLGMPDPRAWTSPAHEDD